MLRCHWHVSIKGCSAVCISYDDHALCMSYMMTHEGVYSFVCTQSSMAELPVEKRQRYLSLGLPPADVLILADELATADFFDAAVASGAAAKAAANWIMGDVMAYCKVC